jgi:murein DD-endopeptidase MepM/ murein hydrolase activator NlpD
MKQHAEHSTQAKTSPKQLSFRSFVSRLFLKIVAPAAMVGTALYFGVQNWRDTGASLPTDEALEIGALPVVNPTVKYGFALDTFSVTESRIHSDQVFQKLLTESGISYHVADSLSRVIKEAYDFNKIQDGKPYLILSRDVTKGADYFIFEPDAKRYIVFSFKGEPSVKEVKRVVTVKEMEATGTIKSSLWATMTNNGLSYRLTDMVEDALKYQMDLRSFQDGDEYKLIYEEEFVDGVSIGIKQLKAAYFKDNTGVEKEIYAIFYANKSEKGYYSKDGLPMKNGFLKSPLKYSHITSSFNLNRLHPILGYVRPHFGTDYAAPSGTPILSVADGVVEEASYTSGNGNYVKIKHMKPYETQYLHMSRYAKGIHKGTKVKQGEVIGYVGQTGLATGPHCCFRFWKNGTQVNHLKEKLPLVSTFSSEDKSKFQSLSNEYMTRFKGMGIATAEQLAAKKKEYEILRGKP